MGRLRGDCGFFSLDGSRVFLVIVMWSPVLEGSLVFVFPDKQGVMEVLLHGSDFLLLSVIQG